jgi:hypothetical protein
MDDGVKPIDQQLDGRWCRSTFTARIVEARRQARKTRRGQWRQAVDAPGPASVVADSQVQAHYWLASSLRNAVRQDKDEPKRQHADGDQHQRDERPADLDRAP